MGPPETGTTWHGYPPGARHSRRLRQHFNQGRRKHDLGPNTEYCCCATALTPNSQLRPIRIPCPLPTRSALTSLLSQPRSLSRATLSEQPESPRALPVVRLPGSIDLLAVPLRAVQTLGVSSNSIHLSQPPTSQKKGSERKKKRKEKKREKRNKGKERKKGKGQRKRKKRGKETKGKGKKKGKRKKRRGKEKKRRENKEKKRKQRTEEEKKTH